MADGIYTAASGAIAYQTAMDVISTNLANASSSGFKQDRVSFREIIAEKNRTAEQTSMMHVSVDKIKTDHSAGITQDAGGQFDVSFMNNEGYFTVKTAQGDKLTRSGSFALSSSGMLVDTYGDSIQGANGPIVVDPTQSVSIDTYGAVWNGSRYVDRLRITAVNDKEELVRAGEGKWDIPADALPMRLAPILKVGGVEQSNVNVVDAMTSLVTISRGYESFHKVISMFRNMDSKATSEIR